MLFIVVVSLFLFFSLTAVGGIVYRNHSGVCKCKGKLNGKTVIITGATAGIGKETAKNLASRGARVILACRNLKKGEETKRWITDSTGNRDVVVRLVDLSDLTSVRKFADETLRKESRIDVLINNAGGGFPDRRESKQGFELTIATNHYGHFLLTNLLLGLIIKSHPSRIINVSSLAHKSFYLDLDDIHFKNRSYGVYKAYSQAKLCNILFTKELTHRLAGRRVAVNSLHPGAVATEIMNKEGTILGFILSYVSKFALKSSELGAQTTIHLAVSKEGGQVSGEYFVDCKIAETSRKALDPGLSKDLWELSEEETELKNNEKYI